MIPHIVQKSIDISYSLFPVAYEKKQKTFHFAYLYKRGKLLAIGQNDPITKSNTALKFAKRFGADQEFPYRHAEVSCFSKLWGRQRITPDMKLVSLRLNSSYELKNAYPCKNCWMIIRGLGIRRVYYSTKSGEIECSI